jgi:hypothetical protein
MGVTCAPRIGAVLRLGAAIAACASVMTQPDGAAAAGTASQAFTTSGEHAFAVPAGVTSVQVTLVGGNGAAGLESHNGYRAPGGAGRIVVATLAVSPGETLFAEVAGDGGTAGAGGYGGGGTGEVPGLGGGGGGGGGGASDVRTCATAQSPASCSGGSSLASRLVVAAGGGGGGGPGGETENPSASYEGGTGGEGDDSGADGAPDQLALGGGGGRQGGQTAPGAAGGDSEVEATAGQIGRGGNGGQGYAGGGGGGGGGIFGGGGGGGGRVVVENPNVFSAAGGGGGGGGSGVPSGASGVSSFSLAQPVPGSQPAITFTWTLPPPASVTGAPSAVTSSAATLTGTVNPDGSSIVACEFTISPAPSSGASVPCTQQVGAGSTPHAISAPVAGLAAATAYTVTLVASSAQGTSTGAPVTFTTAAESNASTAGLASGHAGAGLTVTGLTLSPTRFRRGRHAARLTRTKAVATATTLTFALSEAATVTLTFEQARAGALVGHTCGARKGSRRKGRPCTRYTLIPGDVRESAHAGTDRIDFQGVLDGGKALSPGAYRVSLSARAGGAAAATAQHPTFTLLK